MTTCKNNEDIERMQYLSKEWLIFFVDTNHIIPIDTIYVTIIYNDKIIIDDISFSCCHVTTLLQYFFMSPKCLPNIACLFN